MGGLLQKNTPSDTIHGYYQTAQKVKPVIDPFCGTGGFGLVIGDPPCLLFILTEMKFN